MRRGEKGEKSVRSLIRHCDKLRDSRVGAARTAGKQLSVARVDLTLR